MRIKQRFNAIYDMHFKRESLQPASVLLKDKAKDLSGQQRFLVWPRKFSN